MAPLAAGVSTILHIATRAEAGRQLRELMTTAYTGPIIPLRSMAAADAERRLAR